MKERVVNVTGSPRQPEPERNAPCPCGSKKKYKKCCYIAKHEASRQAEITRQHVAKLRAATAPIIERQQRIEQHRTVSHRSALATAALLTATLLNGGDR